MIFSISVEYIYNTPELWRGAADLCARVRACAGAAESLHACIRYIYIGIYIPYIA